MIKKILIANRGEIALRINRTAQAMGLRTVAVYSDTDQNSRHRFACDEAVAIGGNSPSESYLCVDKIVNAARDTGADAIHPGYGFLSENADFARALEDANLTFIGPSAEIIAQMGDKASAKALMQSANVPVVPGYQSADQSLKTFKQEAAKIGYPLLLKAVAGGGGKGMRPVFTEDDLPSAISGAKNEAQASFGNDRLLMEKLVLEARHIEVQIFGDHHDNIIHLFDRDCSIQRRHQKIVEEAPAPFLPDATRAAIFDAALKAARAVSYVGAGTVEFLYDAATDNFYFMEMNTRLQVEHPVTEAITGLDLVAWQIEIANGARLPRSQDELTINGHAIEVRLCAEDPTKEFLPSTGVISHLALPKRPVRTDHGLETGAHISAFYDPMLGKIITHGPSRDAALDDMARALARTKIAGVATNSRLLHELVQMDAFRKTAPQTSFLEKHPGLAHPQPPGAHVWAGLARALSNTANAPLAGFRLNRPAVFSYWMEHLGEVFLLRLTRARDNWTLNVIKNAHARALRAGETPSTITSLDFSATAQPVPDELSFMDGASADHLHIACKTQTSDILIAKYHDQFRVWDGAHSWAFKRTTPPIAQSAGTNTGAPLNAPMSGTITQLCVKPGTHIEAGAPVLVMEAMKMEHTLHAPNNGRVNAYRCALGEQVAEGKLLVDFVVEK